MEFRAFFIKCSCENDVKKVYRGLAMAHHPDKGGTPERFQILQEEYQYQLRKMAPGYTYASRTTGAWDRDVDYESILRKMREQAATRAKAQQRPNPEVKKFWTKVLTTILTALLAGVGVRITFK